MNAPLLLCRFHKMKTPPMGNEAQRALFVALNQKAGKNGWEVSRTDGSCGLTQVDWELISALQGFSLFPRRSKDIIILQEKLSWECTYISPYRPSDTSIIKWNQDNPMCPVDENHPWIPVRVQYPQPQRGGSFQITPDLAERYPFLYEFTECKFKAAFVLSYLHERQLVPYCITPLACSNEISHLQECTAKGLQRELPTQTDTKTRELELWRHIYIAVMLSNKFTLVCHPVGFHNHVFSDKQDSLENKMTFVNHGFVRSIGRGGNGHRYTWSLLN